MRKILQMKMITTLLLITLMMNTTFALHSHESPTSSSNRDIIINDLNCLGAANFNLEYDYQPVIEVKEGEEKQEDFGTTATVATVVIVGGLSYATVELLKAIAGSMMVGGK